MNPIQKRIERRDPTSKMQNMFERNTDLIIERSYEIIEEIWKINKHQLLGRKPSVIFGAAVYLAEILLIDEEKIDFHRFWGQNDIATLLGTTEVSLGKASRDFNDILKLDAVEKRQKITGYMYVPYAPRKRKKTVIQDEIEEGSLSPRDKVSRFFKKRFEPEKDTDNLGLKYIIELGRLKDRQDALRVLSEEDRDALIYAMTLEMPRKEEEKDE